MRGRTPASSRHLPGWAVVVLVLVLATAVGVIALLRPGGSPQDAGPAGAPAAGRTAAGQGALTSTMTISDLDDVHVSEVVAWPDGGPSRIRLAVREHPELTGDAARAQPRIDQLSVRVDHEVVVAHAVPGTTPAWDVDRPTSAPPKRMVVSYQVRGVVVPSSSSSPGRAIAVFSPLSWQAATGKATLVVLGVGIRNLYCPDLPSDQLLCGRHSGSSWTARLPTAASSPVLVQLDLLGTG